MRLFRAHGLGNDYLLYERGPALTPALVRAICDRHHGVGSDGLLEPCLSPDRALPGVRIHNPDGSEAEKSGNGLRIYAWWRTKGATDRFWVWTRGGIVACAVDGMNVSVEMGVATRGDPRLVEGVVIHPVDLGNPHAVVLGMPPDWMELGARIEQAVPGRSNVQFIEVVGPHQVRARIWERGAGHTLSSGSSACAIAAVVVGRSLATSPVQVEMEGGSLHVVVEDDGRVTLRGPVEPVGTIEVHAGWVARRRG